MRIDIVNMPNIQGKSPQEALKMLYDHCYDTAMQVMRLNNELEDLKQKFARFEQNQR